MADARHGPGAGGAAGLVVALGAEPRAGPVTEGLLQAGRPCRGAQARKAEGRPCRGAKACRMHADQRACSAPGPVGLVPDGCMHGCMVGLVRHAGTGWGGGEVWLT